MSAVQPPPAAVLWEVEQYRVVKDRPDHHQEARDAFGDHSPRREWLDLRAMDGMN
ncbi:hypothetical protein [Myxococcus sp. AB036A]|uniref:hypothetical protein n=1 Tax=Myxococcus sp. AB036A TaxID=2562793 RepID=UPI00129C4D1C|nr:hypothetical protein [Myxococcus sp. AB036A]